MKVSEESPVDRPRRLKKLAALVALAAFVALARSAAAATLDGAVRLGWSSTEFDGAESGSTDHSANLALEQELTPYLRLRFSGIYGEQSASFDGDETFARSSLQPVVELRYGAPNLSWRIGWESVSIDSSSRAEEFDSNALTGNLSWRTGNGFRLGLGYREATNETEDVAALGRGLEQRQGSVDLALDRRHWGVGYAGSFNELSGGSSDLAIEQIRHELRVSAARDVGGDRLKLAFSGTAGRLEAEERRGEGDLGEPVTAIQGFYAIDPSPSLGDLAPVPGLVDGDTAVPTSPPIEIGGANTFRNVGVDFGLPLPATRLDIVVDRASAADVLWDVYQSADGLVWEPLPVVERAWDADLLRYRLRFPESSERYLKAVNLTNNAATDVRVTEVRALRDLSTGTGQQPERSSELYRAAASLAWRISDRMRFGAAVDASNDSTTVGGVVRRESRGSGLRAGLELDLLRELELAMRYRHMRSEESRGQGITRLADDLGASLRWTPLASVDALLTAGLRRDADAEQELSNIQYLRTRVSLDLLDELRLVTDLGASRLETAGTGAARDTINWSERIEMIPRRHWRVNGGYSWLRTESSIDGEPIFDRSSLFVDFAWTPGSALTLTGTISYFDESTGATVRQSFSLSWNPGPKLGVSLGWDQYEQGDGLLTGYDSLAVNYEAGARLVLHASLTRSRNRLAGGAENEVTSLNAGTTLSF